MLESNIEQNAVEYAEKLGYLTFKVSPVSQKGWPDRVFINKNGWHVYIETKKPGKKLRKLQLHRIQQLKERGVEAYWADSLHQIETILDINEDII